MKYGNFRPLLTSSHADITLFVSGRGPHENTPIFDTCANEERLNLNECHENISTQAKSFDTHIWMFALDKFQKAWHIRSTKVIDCLQPGEHGRFR